ncbi:single-stranded DNA-binding protein [Candidatus Microgenomates bacterium]|nr:single-stranded DNA-binding protein [Candidatus Microgenomates bacterium]
MLSLNRAQIIGNLTRDPELRYTANGQAVTSFGVATNRAWNDPSGEKKEAVEFHDVVTWGKLAEICKQILAKGRKVYIEGRLQTRTWEGQDGVKRQKTEIVAENMLVLDRPKDGATNFVAPSENSEKSFPAVDSPSNDNPPESVPANAKEGEVNLEDIPF